MKVKNAKDVWQEEYIGYAHEVMNEVVMPHQTEAFYEACDAVYENRGRQEGIKLIRDISRDLFAYSVEKHTSPESTYGDIAALIAALHYTACSLLLNAILESEKVDAKDAN